MMTDRELLERALKTLEFHTEMTRPIFETNETITALRERLAREEATSKQSLQVGPVSWVDLLKQAEEIVRSKTLWKRFIDGTPLENDIAVWMADFAIRHKAPQPAVREVWCGCGDGIMPDSGAKCGNCVAADAAVREWQGLTKDEVDALWDETVRGYKGLPWVIRAVEAKLREKNHV